MGPIKEGQKVRLELDAVVERTAEGLMLFWGGGMIGLDDDSIVSMEFVDERSCQATRALISGTLLRCGKAEGHGGTHDAGGLEWT
jgi:hypothetical protein